MTEIKEATTDQDLVERLRQMANSLRFGGGLHHRFPDTYDEAAEALTAAQARIAELEKRYEAASDENYRGWVLKEQGDKALGEMQARLATAERERDEAREGFDALSRRMLGVERERDEAQAQTYRLEKTIERYEDEAQKRRHWNDEAKRSRGYSVNVTFDTVWAETCAKADALATAERERDELYKRCLERENWVCDERTRAEAAERERDEARAMLDAIVAEVEPSLDEHGVWAGSVVEAVKAVQRERDEAEQVAQNFQAENERLWKRAEAAERERDNWLNAAENWRKDAERCAGVAAQHMDRALAAERERDEWMEKCEAARSYSDTLIEAKNRMMRERDEARAALKFYEREWLTTVEGERFEPTEALWDDRGSVARRALSLAASAVLGDEPVAASCDGSREAGETERLDPKDDSAVPEGQTPSPSDPVGAKE